MRRREFWLFTGPSLAIMVGLLLFPLGQTVWWSLQHVSYGRPGIFVGLDNYVDSLGSARLRRAVAFTVGLTALATGLKLVLGYGLALALNLLRRGRTLLLGLLIVTYVVPTVIGAVLFSWLFDNTFGGPVNWVLSAFGVEINWLSDPWPARALLIMQVVWHELAFPLIVLLAGLQSVSRDQLEAAQLDGANAWRRQRHVVLPSLADLIAFVVVISVMDGLRIFDAIRVITPAAQSTGTESIMTYVYDVALGQGDQLGLASAVSVLTVILTVLLLIPVLRRTFTAARQQR